MDFKPASNDQAYLKAGLLGFGKSGKTFTASRLAIGLWQHIKSQKPIAFIDTETGSSYVRDLFKAQGIELLTAKSRAFVDLLALTRKAEKSCDILIIDSITHFYQELVKAYKDKLNRTRLRVQDWAPIKEEWAVFTELYLNSKLHIIMCGRAGWDYEFKEDEDGVTEIQKTGTHMKAETDLGYEPSLLIEMEKLTDKAGKIGQFLTHRAWVIGDRFHIINGKNFDFLETDPQDRVFKAFLPHIEKLNLGGEHKGIELESNSQGLFDSPQSQSLFFKRKEIALETLKNELDKRWSTRSDAGQKSRIAALERVFGTASQTAISDMHPERLEEGLKLIKEMELQPNA